VDQLHLLLSQHVGPKTKTKKMAGLLSAEHIF